MGNKKQPKYFVILNPEDRKSQMWVINTLASLFEKYPHLQDKIEVCDSVLVETGTYIMTREI